MRWPPWPLTLVSGPLDPVRSGFPGTPDEAPEHPFLVAAVRARPFSARTFFFAIPHWSTALVAVASGLYIGANFGPGPRDGLMTGISRRTGLSLRVVRTGIEVTALTIGAILGGTVGIGTLAFALLIGPAVQAAVVALAGRPLHEL